VSTPQPPSLRERLLPHPLLSLLLLVFWLLLSNGISPGQLLLGGVLGWAIPLFTRVYWPETLRPRRPLTLARLAAVLALDILVANVVVAWIAISRPHRVRPTFVEVPLDLRSDLAIAVFSHLVSLTPGTLSAHLSADRRTLAVHALDERSPERLAATLKARYESPLKEIFESC
jgi:multicomponent K+:H+ antiporter subunit E